MSHPSWLPALVKYSEQVGKEVYIGNLYKLYRKDFVDNAIIINGKKLTIRKHPRIDGRDKAFWHICGEDETQNNGGCYDRHARICWPKAIILNRLDANIKIWGEKQAGIQGVRFHLWFDKKYLVVIEERSGYFLFITGYITYKSRIKNLEKRFNDNKDKYSLK